ncbi:MAG TPA: hypothetical protein PK203_14145, partial [Cyclobacteriaceae bacterium]|nr:hypothetical protein [Cyclobacteriaceae bacterium]
DTILHNPEKVEVTPASSTVDIIQQSVFFVDKENKSYLLLYLLENKEIETMYSRVFFRSLSTTISTNAVSSLIEITLPGNESRSLQSEYTVGVGKCS